MTVFLTSLESLPTWALVLLVAYCAVMAAFVWWVCGVAMDNDPWGRND